MKRRVPWPLLAALALLGCGDGTRALEETRAWMAQQRAAAKPSYQPQPAPVAEAPPSRPATDALPDPFRPGR